MPVDVSNYNHRGGGNYGIVLRCPNIVANDHLVYFDFNKNRGSWVIRDFIAGLRLDDNHSKLSVAEIVADANYDEFPAWCSVEENPADWKTYLTLRTTAALRFNGPLRSVSTPNVISGNVWQPL